MPNSQYVDPAALRYGKCVRCPDIGVTCDGPNFAAMSMEEIVRWCIARKNFLGLTNQVIATQAGLALGTVGCFFSGTHSDIRMDTLRLILKVLIGGNYTGRPCPDAPTDHDKIVAALEDKLSAANDRCTLISTHAEEKSVQYEKNKQHLLDQLKTSRSYATVVTISFLILLLINIGVLVWDICTPGIGYFP